MKFSNMKNSFAESIVIRSRPSWKFALAVKRNPARAGFLNLTGFRGKCKLDLVYLDCFVRGSIFISLVKNRWVEFQDSSF